MAEWIYQCIKDAKNSTLYAKENAALSLKERIQLYNEELRKNVSPCLYTQYMIWQCDVYVDVTCITMAVNHVFGTDEGTIIGWINRFKEPHHILTH